MKILAFGAHPDDVEVGMGGTIAKYAKAGHEVFIVVTSIPNRKEVRRREAMKSARILGAELIVLDIEPEKLIFDRELVRRFDEVLMEYLPDITYTHWNHDSHQDHVAVANAAIAATRGNNCSLYMYEQTIPGGIVPYGFMLQSFVDISEVIDLKIDSISEHKSQVKLNGEWWLYGIRGRAMYHGYQINVKFSEAFEVVREIKQI
ncbi:MAG: PIG-L family deacetylase [Dehalococcoidales bacterium]|nr:PIG-L family deacetylase [Dehalococcoidales bacterium]